MPKLSYFIMTLELNFKIYIHNKMISIKQINEKDIDLCYELDSNTISLWSKKQWANEFKKEGTKVFGLLIKNFSHGRKTIFFKTKN